MGPGRVSVFFDSIDVWVFCVEQFAADDTKVGFFFDPNRGLQNNAKYLVASNNESAKLAMNSRQMK